MVIGSSRVSGLSGAEFLALFQSFTVLKSYTSMALTRGGFPLSYIAKDMAEVFLVLGDAGRANDM